MIAARELWARWWSYATVRWCELLPPVAAADLAPRLERLGDGSRWSAVWRVEALGYRHAEAERRRGGDPAALFAPRRVGTIPDAALPLLHAGAGLSLFRHRLAALAPGEPARWAVAETVAACRAFARPGLAPAALEALGLVTRYFHRRRVGEVAAALDPGDGKLHGYFWHGVGRCLYFLPGHLARPDGPGTALRRLSAEVPEGAPRAHALAGLAWAVVLVNMDRPRVVEWMLHRHGANALVADDAFTYGVASALAFRVASSRRPPQIVERFLAHRPAPDLAHLWDRRVAAPGRRGVRELLPELRDGGRLGELCRYLPRWEAGRGARSVWRSAEMSWSDHPGSSRRRTASERRA